MTEDEPVPLQWSLFRSKPKLVEAIRYDDPFDIDRIVRFLLNAEFTYVLTDHYVRPARHELRPVHSTTIQIRAGVDGAQGWVNVPLGHWIVRSPGDMDHHWPVDPDVFAATYKPVTLEEDE